MVQEPRWQRRLTEAAIKMGVWSFLTWWAFGTCGKYVLVSGVAFYVVLARSVVELIDLMRNKSDLCTATLHLAYQ